MSEFAEWNHWRRMPWFCRSTADVATSSDCRELTTLCEMQSWTQYHDTYRIWATEVTASEASVAVMAPGYVSEQSRTRWSQHLSQKSCTDDLSLRVYY